MERFFSTRTRSYNVKISFEMFETANPNQHIIEINIQTTFPHFIVINFFFFLNCRSLEVFQQNGTRHSEILKLQRLAGGSGLGGPLRHENSIVLWLRCDQVKNFFFSSKQIKSLFCFPFWLKTFRDILLFHNHSCTIKLKNELKHVSVKLF